MIQEIAANESPATWPAKVKALIDYWNGATVLSSFAGARSGLNAIASDMGLPTLDDMAPASAQRSKINALINGANETIPPGADLYFDFLNDRYFGGTPVLSRSTKKWARDASANLHEFDVNELARFDGLGAVLSPGRTRLSLAPGRLGAAPWSDTSGASSGELGTEGFFTPCRIASGGAATDRRQSDLFSMTAGVPVSMLARYRAGTSPASRVYLRSSALAMQSLLSGNVGDLAQTQSQAGFFSNIENRNLGGGLYEVAATFTPVASQTDWRLGIGPGSTVAGEYVDVLGAQVTDGSGPAEWVFGNPAAQVAVAADQLFAGGVAGNHDLHILLADETEIAVPGWNAADPVPLAGIDGRPVRSITGVAS